MANVIHLSKAPIKEAVFDFRVKLSSDVKPDVFLNLNRELCKEYPLSELHRNIIAGFSVENGKPLIQNTEERVDGYVYKTKDEKNVAQFRDNGFTFSRLSPYTDWVTVKNEAIKLWDVYCSVAKPETITRLALRYINRLELVLPVELEKYFTEPVSISDSISDDLLGYMVRFVVRRGDLMANIIQTTVDLPDKAKRGIIFDIDVFYSNDNGIDKETIWAMFEKLRNFKNLVFFNSITDKTVEMYK